MLFKSKILISACLLGHKVRYDGNDCLQNHLRLSTWIKEGCIITICPETSGGLPTPRPPAEIQNGKSGTAVLNKETLILSNTGDDVTAQFIIGANKALILAKQNNVHVAILKAKSPSCGSTKIYDGTFTRTITPGMGVTAALLSQNGILVFDEEQIDEALDAAESFEKQM